MRTALYFPHTEVRSKSLVRNALLTWDSLEYIAPYEQYRPEYTDVQMAEAMEIIGSARTVSLVEKTRIHELVEDLLRNDVPEIFRYSPVAGAPPYEIWPQKLAESTWNLLQQRGLTVGTLSNMDYPTSEAAGLSLMAIIADVLAGETRARVTDRGQAYATIANAPKAGLNAQGHDTVVALTLKTLSLDQVPIERLIEFRKREVASSTNDYRTLRHNYLDAIESHVGLISKVPIDSADRAELDRLFAAKMEDDFRDLKEELRLAKNEVWLSKDVITLALAGGALLTSAAAGHFAMPEVLSGSGGAVLLGGLLSSGNKLAKSRREILRKHPISYLYEIQP
jgi:hypothetical protein